MGDIERQDSERGIGYHTPNVMALARLLFEEMERLDSGPRTWETLNDWQVGFFCYAIEALLENGATEILRAMSDYDVVLGQPE